MNLTLLEKPASRAPAPLPQPALVGLVAGVRPQASHKALLGTLRAGISPTLDFKAFRTLPEPSYREGRILGATGRVVTTRPRMWIQSRLGSEWRNVAERISKSRLVRTCEVIEPRYFVCRYGPAPWDFLQAEIYEIQEWPTSLVGDRYNWFGPEDVGDSFMPHLKEKPIGRPRYELARLDDIACFVEEEAIQHRAAFYSRLERMRGARHFTVYVDTGEQVERRAGDLPGFPQTPGPSRLQRHFRDWEHSSAGRSGHRYEDYWVLQSSGIPRWAHRRVLPEIRKAKVSGDLQFVDWLYHFDERVGHPFAWYFHMLFGNRILAGAGHRAFELLQKDLLILPEHDARILERWSEHPYGF